MSLLRPITQRTYFANWVVLVLLAGLSFGLSYTHLGSFELPVAMAIAAVKALLVALFFMHLFEHTFMYRFVLLLAVLFIFLLLSFAALDVLTRPQIPIRPPVTHD